MIDKIIAFSINNKLAVGIFVAALVVWGIFSFRQIPIDAVPDITTNQVQVITQTPKLAAQEVEQFVTFPIEISMANLPGVTEIRSISRFGISVVTIVFEDHVDIYLARQLITEQLNIAEREIPEGFGKPELGPISTGLGEVYQYVLYTEPGFDSVYTDMDLRTINDWIVKRQLAGTPGVIEVSGWGGHLKQYEVAVDPAVLNSMQIGISEVFDAIERNNENAGGSYIEKRFNTYFIRGEGLVKSFDDIGNIVVRIEDGIPLLIRDIAKVGFGSAPRYGAITWNGKGEVVGGQALMLKGENSFQVVNSIKERIEVIRKSLPEGVVLDAFLDRSELISRAFSTVTENLILGGLIVIFVLILLLGNIRGGLIVASTIPLSMLVALGLMHVFGVSANLMSLGALDFGIIVDGAVIIVESVVFYLSTHFLAGRKLSQKERDEIALKSSSKMMRSAFFGQLIILIVFIPILTLTGIEGKMFGPMAQTVSFAMIGAIILSFTYVPMMSALFLRVRKSEKTSFADRIIGSLSRGFDPVIRFALRARKGILIGALAFLILGGLMYSRLGGEFIPTLEEGDFALHQILPPGSSLQQSIEISKKIQELLLSEFPEVEEVVSKIGTAEVPTDPMPIEVGDIMVMMKPKKEWVTASSREEMFEKMEAKLAQIPGVQYEFTQPIQMRFNELIAGIREDIAIKIFGENTDILFQKANEAERLIRGISGVGDMKVEQTQGLPQMIVRYQRNKLAQYGLDIQTLNRILRTAFAGEVAGVVFEGEKRFDLVVRLDASNRQGIEDIRNLFVPLPNGHHIPLKEVAIITLEEGPMQISREDTKRRITVGINARGRDIESLVDEIRETLEQELALPPGYYLEYGGAFENLTKARARLAVAVPVALALIFVLVFFALKSLKQTVMIYMSIPFAAIGGVFLLWLRDMPFSISAGVGFIVLSGVAVLNGLVLISSLNSLRAEGLTSMSDILIRGTKRRLRPILLTASTDILGFLPMAISTSAGAEVQRPLATVVIGGLVTATLLTLIVLPILYSFFHRVRPARGKSSLMMGVLLIPIVLLGGISRGNAQNADTSALDLEQTISLAMENHPVLQKARLAVEKNRVLEKTAFNPDRLQVDVSVGEINAAVTDYEVSVVQRFSLPGVYKRRKSLLQSRTERSEYGVALTMHQLEWEVRKSWWDYQYASSRKEVLSGLAGLYREFSHAAERRFQTGESNALERVSAVSLFRQAELNEKKAITEVATATDVLRKLVGLDSAGGFQQVDMESELISFPDETQNPGHPSLQYLESGISVAEKEINVEKQLFLPEVSIGYFNQQIERVAGFQGVKIGLAIPLIYGHQKRMVEATQIEKDMAKSSLEIRRIDLQMQLQNARGELEKHRQEINWYREEGLALAEELLRFGDRAYQSGNASYAEFIQAADQAGLIRLGFLDAMYKYQITVIKIQYLHDTF